MADVESLTVQILRDIRDEIRTTNSKLDTTRTELAARIDATRSELSAGIEQTNMRLDAVETTLLDLAEQRRFVVRMLRTGIERDGKLEEKVESLAARVDALEARPR